MGWSDVKKPRPRHVVGILYVSEVAFRNLERHLMLSYNNNNNNKHKHICKAPKGHNFRQHISRGVISHTTVARHTVKFTALYSCLAQLPYILIFLCFFASSCCFRFTGMYEKQSSIHRVIKRHHMAAKLLSFPVRPHGTVLGIRSVI